MRRFCEPLRWKFPVVFGLVIVWAYLHQAVGHLRASVATVLILGVVAVTGYVVKRRWA